MEKEFIIIKVEIDMKENLGMTSEKEEGFFIIQMEKDMKVIFIKVNHMELILNIQITGKSLKLILEI